MLGHPDPATNIARRFRKPCNTYCCARAHAKPKIICNIKLRLGCQRKKSMVAPRRQPITRHAAAATPSGKSSNQIARKKLSNRKPRSRNDSSRTRWEESISAKASTTGIAITVLLNPAAEASIHSAIRIEETTDTISHPARAQSLKTVFAEDIVELTLSPLPFLKASIWADRRRRGIAEACRLFAACVVRQSVRGAPRRFAPH